jgi:hypothetical protein
MNLISKKENFKGKGIRGRRIKEIEKDRKF